MLVNQEKRKRRHQRVRSKVKGTKDCPRLCVSKSNNYIYAQLINDDQGKTLAQATSQGIKKSAGSKTSTPYTAKALMAYMVGQLIGDKAKELKISQVVFDRGGYQYHGCVKALAEGARESGLKF